MDLNLSPFLKRVREEHGNPGQKDVVDVFNKNRPSDVKKLSRVMLSNFETGRNYLDNERLLEIMVNGYEMSLKNQKS